MSAGASYQREKSLGGVHLVAFVALQDRALRRLHASGALWADVPERRANSSLADIDEPVCTIGIVASADAILEPAGRWLHEVITAVSRS